MFNLFQFIRDFDAADAHFIIDAFPDYPVYSVVLYLLAVFFLPDYLKRRGITFQLKYITAAWNLFLSAFSTLGAYYTLRLMYDFLFVSRNFYTSSCEMLRFAAGKTVASYSKHVFKERQLGFDAAHPKTDAALSSRIREEYYRGPTALFVAFFLYLKTPELLDTVFLILQNKPVSFLHWFHHIVTAIYCWHSSYVLIPSGLFFITMNYSVHSIMYFYFFLVVMGLRQKIRWFAPVITLLQVTQMFLGMYVTCYTYLQYWLGPEREGTLFYAFCNTLFTSVSVVKHELVHVMTKGALVSPHQLPAFKMSDHFSGCDSDPTNLRMGVMMYGTYCVLFGVLFKELYLDKRANRHSIVLARRQAAEKEARSGNNGTTKAASTCDSAPLEGSSPTAEGRRHPDGKNSTRG